ncbi:MAG: hypothetical protein LQ351_004681 [Letrouitia transgressa]|nr:MAG: hypothetical protein LQ351_004681 [Letrouitia transgressa]
MSQVNDDEKSAEKAPSPTKSDEQAYLEEASINEKSLIRKLDRKLLPAVTILYLLSFLDRSNVGNARIEGLTEDLHMTGNQYLTSLTIYFVGYVIFEVPSNVVLKRTSPKLWLPTLTLAWGIVATLMGVTQNFGGFLAVRFFLGITEGGLFPGVVFFLSMWYKRRERAVRVAFFFSAASVAGAFGGILAYGISFMKGVGGYNGWRWIFILEGLLTVVVSAASYYFITDYPRHANFLSDTERRFIHARLAADSDASQVEGFDWGQVNAALRDPKCWLYGLGFHTLSLPLYTLSLFLPTIIKGLGYSAAQAQLLTIPPYALAACITLLLAYLSERLPSRAPLVLAAATVASVGYIVLLSAPAPGASYTGTILAAAGIYPSVAIVLAWPANNVAGQTKRATANAMQISIGNLGAVLGTQLYRARAGPRFFVGHGFALGYMLANMVVVSVLWLVLARENKKRDSQEGGAAEGKGEGGQEWAGDDDPRWRFRT